MEPPPAATVLIAIIGARMRTPATAVSNARSKPPAYSATSVDVPPMSNPMIWSSPAIAAVRAAPTMPPAGPERIASLPWKAPSSASPPFDGMKYSRTPASSATTWST
jgi:hypothetical protein